MQANLIRCLPLLLTLGVLTAFPAVVHAEAETYTDVANDRGMTGFVPACGTDPALISDGRTMSQYHYTVDANGGFHLATHSFIHASGTSEATGDRYLYLDNGHFGVNDVAALTGGGTGGRLLIAAGPGDDARQATTSHSTENANGEPTASVLHERVDPCAG
jgi:hypothetical protein